MNTAAAIASPCMNVCTLDATGRVCTGCLRTTEEIAGWAGFSDARRAQVIGALTERHRIITGQTVALQVRVCSQCGTTFGCGADGPERGCWCTRYPPAAPRPGATCLCPACLAAATN